MPEARGEKLARPSPPSAMQNQRQVGLLRDLGFLSPLGLKFGRTLILRFRHAKQRTPVYRRFRSGRKLTASTGQVLVSQTRAFHGRYSEVAVRAARLVVHPGRYRTPCDTRHRCSGMRINATGVARKLMQTPRRPARRRCRTVWRKQRCRAS